ncbi:hypothetical protein HUN42_00068 [Streptomyces phage Dagobah]|nr:hypothetical protein HUN42_00068 [Streptomyces phage Dagobah]
MSDYSPTGYWANYHTVVVRQTPDGEIFDHHWHDSYPVVDVKDDLPRVIYEDGTVLSVQGALRRLQEGGDIPDEEGRTYRVTSEVNSRPDDGEA